MIKKPTYTDSQLIEGCLQNDRFYQERLYRKYAPTMLRMCYRHTKDQHEALEIVNNGFLKVFLKLDSYSNAGSFEGWIRKIVFRSLSDFFRSKNRSIHFLELDDRDSEKTGTVLDDLYLEDLLGIIELLPDLSRKVFSLYAIEGFTHKEIAEMLNMKEGTSKWYLSEARKQLKMMVKNQSNNQYYAR
jgi:RNA polymerase sigma-70 factor (ECF subfamily)